MFHNVYQGKKVLVIGHTGFKGSWLCAWLNKLGAKVYGFSKDIPTSPSHFEILDLKNMVTSFEGDIRDFNSLQKTLVEIKPDFLFHLAAMSTVKECIENPIEAFETNLMGTIKILKAIEECPNILASVIITSDKCYENYEWEFAYRETDRLGGVGPYSASKACAELAFSSFYKTFLKDRRLATARAGNVIGGGDWACDRIVPDLIRSWYSKKELVLRSPGATRPWQHVLEPLSGYLLLGASLTTSSHISGKAFNFGPDPGLSFSVLDLVEKAKKKLDFAMSISPKECLEASRLKLSSDRALSELSWRPTLNFEETFNLTLDWYKSYCEKGICHTLEQIEMYQNLGIEKGAIWAR